MENFVSITKEHQGKLYKLFPNGDFDACNQCCFYQDSNDCAEMSKPKIRTSEAFDCLGGYFIEDEQVKKVIEIVPEKTTGIKFDSGKPQYGLLPPDALLEVVKVLTYGAVKYAPDNWRKVDNALKRYFDAAQRHQWEWKSGESTEWAAGEKLDESGMNHLAHAIASLLFMLQLQLEADKQQKGTNEN